MHPTHNEITIAGHHGRSFSFTQYTSILWDEQQTQFLVQNCKEKQNMHDYHIDGHQLLHVIRKSHKRALNHIVHISRLDGQGLVFLCISTTNHEVTFPNKGTSSSLSSSESIIALPRAPRILTELLFISHTYTHIWSFRMWCCCSSTSTFFCRSALIADRCVYFFSADANKPFRLSIDSRSDSSSAEEACSRCSLYACSRRSNLHLSTSTHSHSVCTEAHCATAVSYLCSKSPNLLRSTRLSSRVALSSPSFLFSSSCS